MRKNTPNDLLERYYKSKLDKKSYNQLHAALHNPQDRFWSEIILPNAIIEDDGRPVHLTKMNADEAGEIIELLKDRRTIDDMLCDRPGYICLSSNKKSEGRSQIDTLSTLEIRDWRTGHFADGRSSLSYFTNHMRFGIEGDSTWNHPSQRVVMGPVTIFTQGLDRDKDD